LKGGNSGRGSHYDLLKMDNYKYRVEQKVKKYKNTKLKLK
jgi:hypothetical protein